MKNELIMRRLAMVLFALAIFTPFAAVAAFGWKIIWFPNPGIFPPSIPIPVPS